MVKSFFTIIFCPHDRTLKIPDKFAEENADELSDNVRLHVPTGGSWSVGVERKADKTIWLHDGLSKLMEDHSIGYGYLLIFKYNGNSDFNVQIFDLTATEIQYSCSNDSAGCNDMNWLPIADRGEMVRGQEMLSAHKKRFPSFFKVFMLDTSSQRMKFPKAFTLYTKDAALPQKVFLKDDYGNLWPVELGRTGDDYFFLEGWKIFIEDNALEQGDILTFQFDGSSIFHVQLYGKFAVGKKGVGKLLSAAKAGKVNDKGKEVCETIGSSDTDGSDADEVEETETEEEKEAYPSQRKVLRLEEKTVGKEKAPTAEETGHSKGSASGGSGNQRPKVRETIDIYGADIFRSGLYQQPKNPYFVTKIRARRQDELYVPCDVVKDFKLTLPQVLTLRDPVGRTFTGSCSVWKDGRIWYTGGWRSLCKWNLVTAKDKCICEFIKEAGGDGLYLQIHIVRAEV